MSVAPRELTAREGSDRLTVENFTNLLCQRLQVEGLLQECHAALENAIAEDAVVGVTGDVEDLHVRLRRAETRCYFTAAEPRHDHVRNENLDRPVMCRCNFESMNTIDGFEDWVARPFEIDADEDAHTLFVFHEKNGFISWRRSAGRSLCGAFIGFRQHLRKINLEGRAVSHFAVHPDVSAALLHDAVHRCQAEPGAFALLFRGKKRLENARLCCCVHSAAGVAHNQHYVMAGAHPRMKRGVTAVDLNVSRLDRDPPSLRHRVARVNNEI